MRPEHIALRPVVAIPEQRLFGSSEAARYLGIHKNTLLKMTQEGAIPAYSFRNGKVYRLEDLEALVDSLEAYPHVR